MAGIGADLLVARWLPDPLVLFRPFDFGDPGAGNRNGREVTAVFGRPVTHDPPDGMAGQNRCGPAGEPEQGEYPAEIDQGC